MIGHGGLLHNVLGMSRGFTLRHAHTIENTEASSTAPLSSGRIVLRVTIVEGACSLSSSMANITACTDAGVALAPLLSGGNRLARWQSTTPL